MPKFPVGTTVKYQQNGYIISNTNMSISVYGYTFETAYNRFNKRAKEQGIRKQKLRQEVRSNNSGVCYSCGARSELTTDHIVPKSFFASFGRKDYADRIENITIMCKRCNSLKDSLIDFGDPATREIVYTFLKQHENSKENSN